MRIALFVLMSVTASGQWDRFRGPDGTGVSDSGNLPSTFGAQSNVLWRVELGSGHSSPIISNGHVYLTTAGNGRLFTVCLDAKSGQILWKQEAPRPRRERLHSLNNAAAPTPASDGANVYVFFPDFGLLSYTSGGKERWRLPMGPFNNVYGIGVSPILADDVVVTVIDQDKNSFITAAGKNDGKVRWQKPRPEALSGASTPVAVKKPGRPSLILAPGSFRMDVYSARDGEAEWWVRGLPSEMKAVPVLAGDLVYIAGFNTPENDAGKQLSLPSWSELLSRDDSNKDGAIQKQEVSEERTKRYWNFIDTDATGAIEEGEWNLHLAVMAAENGIYVFRMGARGDETSKLSWKYPRSAPQLPSPVVYRGVVYMLNDTGVLTTLDASTGQKLAQNRLRGESSNYYASPVAGDGKVFIASHNGVVAVLRAGGQQELLAANALNEDIFATPAIADGRLYVRTVSALYCFGLR
ncbi:MAG: PQQ-binding-like beta-propeller repeat protein [Acidobacteriota bacterium]